jgi:hypothetical protein
MPAVLTADATGVKGGPGHFVELAGTARVLWYPTARDLRTAFLTSVQPTGRAN